MYAACSLERVSSSSEKSDGWRATMIVATLEKGNECAASFTNALGQFVTRSGLFAGPP